MKILKVLFFIVLGLYIPAFAQQNPAGNLKIVFIRHGEKPKKGDNLTCQGFNRSLLLPKLLKEKFGVPVDIFVPALVMGGSTSHSRMFQTIAPFAIKYNLHINTNHGEKDSVQIANDLKSKNGTLILVWEHKAIAPIVRALGVNAPGLKWPDDDFDSIWIVTFKDGVAVLTTEKEGLKPAEDCKF